MEALGAPYHPHLMYLGRAMPRDPGHHHLQVISSHLGFSSSHPHYCLLSLMEQLTQDLPLTSLCSTESSFPIDISAVKKDHSFLDQDSLKSLCR